MKARYFIVGVSSLLALAPVGCASQGTPPPATPVGMSTTSNVTPTASPASTTVDNDDELTADLREHHRHHNGGFAMFVAMSLDSLGSESGPTPGAGDTSPQQSAAITKIQSDIYAALRPAQVAEKDVLSTLADGIAAGSIEKARVDTAIMQLSAAAAGAREGITDSLNQLHSVLTPAQREALVDKVEAHFEVWGDVNSEDDSTDRNIHEGHLRRVATEIGLSPDQVDKIRATFKESMAGTMGMPFDPKESEAQVAAFGHAFMGESFDAKTLSSGAAANTHMVTWGARRMAHFYEAVSPVLTADQRVKLADSLRWHARTMQPQAMNSN
jgi:Spy/CpxP family protein refolding chaperone